MNRVGIQSLKTIQRWEGGEPIQANNLSALADAVGATVETILGLPEKGPLADPLQNHEARIAELEATTERILQLIAARPPVDPAALRREAEALSGQDADAVPSKRGRGRKR
jgi:hypothetical protein